MEKYNISRYEEKSDALFICINHTGKPVYIEHFFTEEERATEASRKATIERLIGELYVMADEYVEPEKFVSKIEEVQAITLSTKNIESARKAVVAEKLAKIEEKIISKE